MAASIEDRLAINDLFVRYATALDNGDVEGIVACFTPDGWLDSPAVGRHEGEAGIRGFAERFARFHAAGAQLRHVLSNLAVTVDGDSAHATCYLVNILTLNGKTEMGPPGRYDCELVRRAGAWLFRRRTVVLDAPFPLPGL